jgi:transposase InsO family protein
MWMRWKAGQSLHEIGRVFGKDHVSIQFMLAQHGGIAPASRRRPPLTLTLGERENISRGIASGSSIREIAKGLERAASAVGREVARHGGRPLYRASDADQQAWESALRPKRCLLAIHGKLRDGCLNGEIFYSMSEAQVVIEKWRVEYNTRRPHSALDY